MVVTRQLSNNEGSPNKDGERKVSPFFNNPRYFDTRFDQTGKLIGEPSGKRKQLDSLSPLSKKATVSIERD